jgi:hypothetical protein
MEKAADLMPELRQGDIVLRSKLLEHISIVARYIYPNETLCNPDRYDVTDFSVTLNQIYLDLDR